MTRGFFTSKVAARVYELAMRHEDTWAGESDVRWLQGLVEEVGELASALAGRHKHTPDYELRQIAAIALNWLAERQERDWANDHPASD